MHYWGVWHGNDDIEGFRSNIGRFMVEWGFQSYPDYQLLQRYVSPEYLSLNSEVMQNRQKSYVGNKKIIEQMEKWMFGTTMPDLSFEEFVISTQMFQRLVYYMTLNWHINKKPHCMGTLLWQLNDCWPGPSWSIINYNGKPKLTYQEVKKVFSE